MRLASIHSHTGMASQHCATLVPFVLSCGNILLLPLRCYHDVATREGRIYLNHSGPRGPTVLQCTPTNFLG